MCSINACGYSIMFLMKQVSRPKTMKKDGIQTRKRKPKSPASMGKCFAYTKER